MTTKLSPWEYRLYGTAVATYDVRAPRPEAGSELATAPSFPEAQAAVALQFTGATAPAFVVVEQTKRSTGEVQWAGIYAPDKKAPLMSGKVTPDKPVLRAVTVAKERAAKKEAPFTPSAYRYWIDLVATDSDMANAAVEDVLRQGVTILSCHAEWRTAMGRRQVALLVESATLERVALQQRLTVPLVQPVVSAMEKAVRA